MLAALSARRTVKRLWGKWQEIDTGPDQLRRGAVQRLRQSRRNQGCRVANRAGAAGNVAIVACLHRNHIVGRQTAAAEERHGRRGGSLHGTEQDE